MTIAATLLRLAEKLPSPRVIYDREGGSPYLSRWYLIGKRRDPDPYLDGQLREDDTSGWGKLPFHLFLHRFHRSDDDGALHNHPWKWAVSFILAGGYLEEYREGDEVLRRHVKPLRFNFLTKDSYHRVDLVNGEAWSLFLVGPTIDTWYFWDRNRKARCHWRKFIVSKRDRVPAPWEPDSRAA